MKIKEILELTLEMPTSKVSKQLPCGEKKLREILNTIGCEKPGVGKKGWTYNGDPSVIEKDISEFLHRTAITKRTDELINKNSNNQIKEPLNSTKNDIMESEKPIKNEKNQPSENEKNQPSNIVRKRTSFDLDTNLLKQLKLKAVMEERNLYELVEQAIRGYLKGEKK